jgi:uncharacterized protein
MTSAAEFSLDAHSVPRLVILQPTSLCNLNCSYCYVPGRREAARMSDEVLEAVAAFILTKDTPPRSIDFLWHAGEPLTAGMPFYRRAFELLDSRAPPGVVVQHVMQTNGTLVNQQWCDLLREYKVRVGISLDGPEEIHDRSRRTWGDRGSHRAAMRGYRLLRAAGLAPGAICVLTRHSLERPDEIYDFFKDEGFPGLAFNVEESEGTHTLSGLRAAPPEELLPAYRAFMSRIWERWRADEQRPEIREFQHVLQCIAALRSDGSFVATPDEVVPFGIITIARDGSLSTFSPELLATKSRKYGDFVLGNVLHDTLESVARGVRYTRLADDVLVGRARCETSCGYYAFCGSGYQANRFMENGSVRSTETLTCRLHRQVLVDVVTDALLAETEASPAKAGAVAG